MPDIILPNVTLLNEISDNANILIENKGLILKYQVKIIRNLLTIIQDNIHNNEYNLQYLNSIIDKIKQQLPSIQKQFDTLKNLQTSIQTNITVNTQNIETLKTEATPIVNGGTAGTTINKARKNLGFKMDCLWGGGSTWDTGNITLSKPYTDYDIIVMVYSHQGENVSAGAGYVFSTCYPVPILENIRIQGAYFATFGYDTRFRRYNIPNTSTFNQVRNGDSGTTGMIGVYGLKCS